MDIRQLTYFVSTYEHNSFSAAAKECCVTVQTISKAISNLEQDLNNELLFVRKNNGVIPTEFGRAFYPKAVDALKSFDSAASYIDEYHEQRQPHEVLTIKLCVPDFPRSRSICVNINKLLQVVTRDIKVETQIATFPQGIKALDSLEADMLVTLGEPDTNAYDVVRVGVMPTAVVVTENHPSLKREYVTREDLESFPVIYANDFDMDRSGSIVNMYKSRGYDLHLHKPNNPFSFAFTLFKDKAMCLVIGIPAIVPEGLGLVMKQIDPNDMLPVPICLITRKGSKPQGYKAVETFLLNDGLMKGFSSFK